MKNLSIIACVAVAVPVICFSSACFAATNAASVPLVTFAAARADDSTRLVVDKNKNTVAILIKGKQVGLFDSNGLHVTGDFDYTGVLQQVKSPAAGKAGAQ